MFQTSEPCIKLHAVAALEHFLSEQCPLLQVCVHLDGSNAENKIALLVILCIIMYVKKQNKKKKIQNRFFFLQNPYPTVVKCLNIGKNIGQPIYRRSLIMYRFYTYYKYIIIVIFYLFSLKLQK